MSKLSRVSLNSLIVASFFLLDKALAFVRAGIVARQYSDSVHLLDTFNAANNLPDILFAVISGGALGMAFVPLMTEYLTTRDRAAAWDLFSRVANFTFTITATLAIVIALLAEPIANFVIAPGFPAEQKVLLAQLMRLNLVGTVIFSISGLVMASLQANQHFVLPALAPALYNVGQIIGAIFLVPRFGIHGLVYGVIIGAAMHLLIQIPALVKFGFRWTPSLNLRHTGLLDALKLLAPRLLTMAGIQVIVWGRDFMASFLNQPGAVTSLTYGWMVMQVPETILGTAIATAMLPTLSEFAARGNWSGFRDTVERALRVLIALTLPIAAVMAAGIHPLVRAVFGFDETITTLLTWTTRAYLLTLTGYTVHEIAARSFYARKEPWFPFFAVLLRIVIFFILGGAGVVYLRSVGAPMLAFAEIALLVEAIFLFSLLSWRMHEPLRVGGSITRGLAAALVGGASAYGLAVYVPGGAVTTALLGMSVGGIVALVIVWKDVRLLLHL
jgi:putative peptidoglycan lipid II flippase